MNCTNFTEATFQIFTIDYNGKHFDYNKSFSISLDESRNLDNYTRAKITDNAIVLAMFRKVFNWTVGLNGYCLRWVSDHEAIIRWHHDTWLLKKVIPENSNDRV